jgi:hypothetical protein
MQTVKLIQMKKLLVHFKLIFYFKRGSVHLEVIK